MLDRSGDPSIRTFGGVSIQRPHRSDVVLSGTSRTLLALLVTAHHAGLTLEEIASDFWSDVRPAGWQSSLKFAVARLRQQLEPEFWITYTGGGSRLRLAVNQGWVDAWRLETLDLHGRLYAHDIEWILAGPPFDGVLETQRVRKYADQLSSVQRSFAASWEQQEANRDVE